MNSICEYNNARHVGSHGVSHRSLQRKGVVGGVTGCLSQSAKRVSKTELENTRRTTTPAIRRSLYVCEAVLGGASLALVFKPS